MAATTVPIIGDDSQGAALAGDELTPASSKST